MATNPLQIDPKSGFYSSNSTFYNRCNLFPSPRPLPRHCHLHLLLLLPWTPPPSLTPPLASTLPSANSGTPSTPSPPAFSAMGIPKGDVVLNLSPRRYNDQQFRWGGAEALQDGLRARHGWRPKLTGGGTAARLFGQCRGVAAEVWVRNSRGGL
ncbi:hypothetical protein NL676_013040 [Syzygium grande]|nr:hypothetical protein NL676_013040 [Syzygium grande]